MNARQLVTIAIVSTLLIGGFAALGAATPADQASDNATDAYDDNATDAYDDNATDASADNASDNADGVGPSDGLPEQAPDHVSKIHDRIDSFLSGSIENLGESLGDLLGGETAEEAGEDAADGTADV